MNLLTKSGILSLFAVCTISLNAMAQQTITETPNRPEENPFQDCEEDIVGVDVSGKDDDWLRIWFEDGSWVFIDEQNLYNVQNVFEKEGVSYGGLLLTEEWLCPDEAKLQMEAKYGLLEKDTIEETVKSEPGQNYLQSHSGEHWYESQHRWMQDQVDEWTREYNTEHAPECPTDVIKEYSTGVGNPDDSELTPDEIRFLENLLGDGDSEDSAIAIPNL